ncbi:MAG: tRNA (adenosine(37)-N6)-threonylcarbamoyltransferase complex ATPase subunit type 1 TsaE, partial [Flavobacteriaceae bacterium]
MKLIFKKDELEEVAHKITKHFSHKVIRIDGPMGSGKTTLIRNIGKVLGVKEEISSPTFSLVNSYKGLKNTIYHFDFYRLEHPDEALDFGVEEYFESGALCFLEWAEHIRPHLPLQYDHFKIDFIDNNSR